LDRFTSTGEEFALFDPERGKDHIVCAPCVAMEQGAPIFTLGD
jgi:hypothetical protein